MRGAPTGPCALLIVCMCAAPAAAQDAGGGAVEEASSAGDAESVSAEAQARSLFERGLELAEQDRHAEALALFRESLALVPRPSSALNVAIQLYRLGQGREALEVLDSVDTLAPSEADRRDAEALRERIRATLATVVLRVSPPEAEVTVDGEVLPGRGAERTFALDPGQHRLAVSAPGHATMRRQLTVMAGTEVDERVTLVSLAPADVARSGGGPVSRPEEDSAEDGGTALWIGIGVGVVAVAGAVLAAILLSADDPTLYGGTFPPDNAFEEGR